MKETLFYEINCLVKAPYNILGLKLYIHSVQDSFWKLKASKVKQQMIDSPHGNKDGVKNRVFPTSSQDLHSLCD